MVPAGATAVGWIVAQLPIMGKFFVLQPVVLVAGTAILVLAWWSLQEPSVRTDPS